jgi:hypothetical protein
MATVKAPSGQIIWKAVREELLLNLYVLPFSTIAPTVYHVYLHPEDFEAIEGVAPRVVEQIRQALSAEVERANRGLDGSVRSWMSKLLDREQTPPIEIPPGGWEVYLRPDPNGELGRGQLGIVSTLAMPAPAEYAGTPTTRIVRSVVGASGRSATVSEVPQAPAPAVVPAAPVAPAPVAPVTVAPPPLPNPQGSGAAGAPGPAHPGPGSPAATPDLSPSRETEARTVRDRARLTYHDEQGSHAFVMRKDTVSIGRGGSAAWVDVQVIASSRVSREHLRIRADAEGRFFAQDVSLWGTTVDGGAIPPAVKGPEGVAQPGAEHPLPARCRISLADAVLIDFEVLGAP